MGTPKTEYLAQRGWELYIPGKLRRDTIVYLKTADVRMCIVIIFPRLADVLLKWKDPVRLQPIWYEGTWKSLPKGSVAAFKA